MEEENREVQFSDLGNEDKIRAVISHSQAKMPDKKIYGICGIDVDSLDEVKKEALQEIIDGSDEKKNKKVTPNINEKSVHRAIAMFLLDEFKNS